MSGHGELWVDENGLPRRQVIDLEIPKVTPEYDARIHLVVDFDFSESANQQIGKSTNQQIGKSASKLATLVPRIAPSDVLCLMVALVLAAALITLRRRRWVYAAVVVTVSMIMVVMPLLQADGIVRFHARQAEAAASTPSIAQALGVSDQSSIPTDTQHATRITDHATRITDHASRITFHASRASSSSNSSPTLYCGKGSTAEDADNDGLSDAAENCLGTDPYHEDSDRDLITDTVEIDGFYCAGRHWSSDPFKPDSNNDGLADFAEWPEPVGSAPRLDVADAWDPDGDGVPNLWDEDNDGDQVPDSLDLSAFARTSYTNAFSLTIQGGGFDGYAYVEIQVQPKNLDHLRYSTTLLDWPYDELGQIMDLDDSPEDIRLFPILKVRTNQPPDKDLARRYGVTVFEDDGAYDLYMSLSPIGDGGRMVAFYAKVAYGPDELDDIRWEKVELVWMVQMSMDQQAGGKIKTSVTPLHNYVEESFRVTGLQITKSRNYESAILGTPDYPDEDRFLFNLLFGSSNTFLTHEKPVLQAQPGQDSIKTRFTNPNTPLEKTWGVTSTLVTIDLPADPYGHADEGIADLPTRIRNFLETNNYPTDSNPSLVIATQEEVGLHGLDDQGRFEPPPQFNVNLNNVEMSTLRGLKSNSYQYEDGAWQSLDLEETLDLVEQRYEDDLADILEDLEDEYPDLTEEDLKLLLNMFYTAWYMGQVRIIKADGQTLVSESRSDQDVYDELNQDEDTLPAYLLQATGLGQPGGGLKIGDDQTQTWTYMRDQEQKGSESGFIDPKLVMVGMWSAGGVKTVLSIKTAFQAVKFAALTDSFRGRMKIFSDNAGVGSRKLSMIGAIIGVAVIWSVFFFTAYSTGWDWDSPVVKEALAYAAVATVVTVLLFVISLNPIGAILVAFLSFIDLIFFAVSVGELSAIEWAIRSIAELFYDWEMLTEFEDADFVDFDTAVMDEEMGLIVGNRFRVSDEFVGKIKRTSEGDDEDLDDSWVDAAYHGSATGATAVNKNSRRTCSRSDRILTCRNDVGVEYRLDTAKRDAKLTVNSSVEAKTFYEECTWFGLSCDRKSIYTHLPDDLPKKDRWDPMTFYLDVLPNNIHDLFNWSVIINPDLDGDGLTNDEENSLGTDRNKWDSDGDGLADKFEFDSQDSLGTDPTRADTDGDGLSDGLEYRIGTSINAADTDDDGLTDGEEVFHQDAGGDWVGGWLISLPGRAEPVRVFSNPLVADADGDGLNDRSERSLGTSPYAFNDSPHLTLKARPSATSPSGATAVYVEPGDRVSVELSLDNTAPRPVTSTLTLCMGDFLTDLQYEATMSGDRHPPTQAAASCHGLQWSFAHQHTLLEHEVVSTTITTTVANLSASASAEMTATLPYQMGDEEEDITDQVTVIVDVDDPEATITAPSDGALLGGGISHYVIGGAARDETSWVTLVEVNLPNGGWVKAEGISPWAYTWELPADGQYTLQARAHDYLKHEGLSGMVNVTVDNTPPEVTLDLADGQVVTTQSSDVISITLEGSASDNLSGLTRVQVSTDGRPWREVWAEGGAPLTANWSTKWTLPNEETAQGRHTVDVRAIDRAGNRSDVLRRTIIVDVVPPTSELTGRTYLQDPPPHVPTNQPLDLYGVANDAGRVPQPSRPVELVGELDGLDDATIWLELSSVTDDDDGVSVAWIGDFNADRLGDLVIGLPAAEGGKGEVTIVYGRAGGWPTPTDAEVLADSPTSLVGKDGARIGDMVAPAGDVNGDGFDDLLIGDSRNDRAFLVFGQPGSLGRDRALDGPRYPYWSVIDLTGLGDLSGLAAAGDVNGDGLDDLLIGTAGAEGNAYLLLGQSNPWLETVPLDVKAAAVIDLTGLGNLSGLSTAGDMDGDQYDEFVVVDGTTVYLFEGRDSFAPGRGEPNETLTLADDAIATFNSSETRPEVAALGDVNGDGLADFIYADGNQPKLVFGNAKRNWTTQALNFTPAPSGFLAAPGDVDDDGLADILVGNADGDAYLILGKDLSEVKATLTDVKAAASTLYPAGADLNSDGSSDLLLVPAELGVSSVLAYGKLPHIDPAALPVAQSARSSDFSRLERLKSLLQTHHYVNDDGTCEGGTPCYASIQDAVNAASDGDTINVEPGVYASFTVNSKNNLTISGVHADAVFVDGAGGAFAVKVQNATGVTLKKLTLRNADDAVYLDHAGVGGYENQSLITNIQYLLLYDFTSHALAMDRVSTAKLTRCTLAGGDNHIHLYGDPDPAMDASWSTVSTDSRTATTADGGIFADSDEIYFVDDSGQMDIYKPGTGGWRSLAEPPKGVHAAATADENGHLWALRRDPSTGFDGPVYAIAYVSANEIYVGGDFQHAGDVATPYIAQWDGSQWHAVTPDRGFRPNGPVYAILVNGGRIYAGGTFGLRYLPEPTQQQPFPSWENWGDISGGGAVYTMVFHDGGVFVGGTFDNIGGVTAHKIAKREANGEWKRIADPPSDSCNGILSAGRHVSALVNKDGIVYLGGQFHEVGAEAYGWQGCRDPAEYGLAKSGCCYWISGLPKKSDLRKGSDIYTLAFYGNDMVVGGRFDNVTCYYEDGYYDGWWPKSSYCVSSGNASNLAIFANKYWHVPGYLKANAPVRTLQVVGNQLYIGGDFTQVGGSTAAEHVAYYDSFPGGGGAWHTLGSGVNGSVRALVHRDGHTYIGGTFTLAGGNAALRFAHWDGSQWVGLSEQAFYEYLGGSWQARAVLPDFVGEGASLVSDGNGHLYAVPGSGSRELYRYTISSDTWEKKASLPGGLGAGGGLAWVDGYLYALRGGNTRDLYRYDPTENKWGTRAPIPAAGPVVGVGGSLAWDGRDWLYVLAGGNGTGFLRYHIHADKWETLHNTSKVVNLGGGLARIGQHVYGVPGGGQELWSYDPIAIYPQKLTLDHVAVIAPKTASASTWINLDDLVVWPDDFVVGGSDNTWVGRSGMAWSPQPILDRSAKITHDGARLLDPDRDVYRVGTGTKLDGGYHTYRPDAIVAADGSQEFTSIQAAVLSSANRVLLRPGTYKENFYLISGVEVVGDSADLTIVEPPVGAGLAPALVRAEGVVGAKLSMLTLNGAGSGMDGLSAEDGTRYVVVKQNIIRGTDTGITVSGGKTELEVVNNTIVYNDDGMVASNCAPLDVRNTIFAYHTNTGLAYEGCATRKLHKYNLYWNNTTDLSPNDPGAGELFLDPLFVNPGAPSHDYHTEDGSPVIDAGDPGDPPPPGAGARVDIGYVDQNRAGLYVDDDYCATCANDGLSWQVDAFDKIQDALDKAAANIHDLKGLRYTVAVAAGTYTETLTVPSHVRLVGAGAEETVIDAHTINGTAVTFDGVVESEITGFTVRAYTNTTAISVTGASNAITITRNIIETWNETSTASAVAFSGRATGWVSFNTLASHIGNRWYDTPEGQRDNGISSSGVGTWVAVENNIFTGPLVTKDPYGCDDFYEGHFYGLHTLDYGQIFNGYNLLRNLIPYQDDANTGLSEGPGDLPYYGPCFEYGTYRPEPASPARDAASPYAEVPPGGGERADMGYYELTATPAAVFLGREDVSSATGNSGVSQVEIGFSQVNDPSSAVTDTLPSTWTPVTLDTPQETVSYWQTSYTPTVESLYRFYSRAADVATNEEQDEQDWYDGAFVADSTPPVVTWTRPVNGTILNTPLELRAQVSDYAAGEFSVEDVYFVVDGDEVQAEWAADPWDEEAQDPRTFRAWVELAIGAHSAFAVAEDRTGNQGQCDPVGFTVSGQDPADTTAPLLVVVAPAAGGWFTSTVVFSGTVTDVGSGVAAVEVSLDGGFTWQPATVDGTDWELTWEAPEDQEFISYPAWVRARDQAGNSTQEARTFSIDNVPPIGPRVEEFTAFIGPFEKDAPPGTHFDMPLILPWSGLRITWARPFDGSGYAETLITVDQVTDTLPTENLGVVTSTVRSLATPGDWYVHLAVRDLVGNQFIRHYGPWHVGTFADASTNFANRVQTIVVDGQIDTDLAMEEWHGIGWEWGIFEFMDDFSPTTLLDWWDPQQMFTTWDGSNLYLGWSGAWWTLDGDLWIYLNTRPGSCTHPVIPMPTCPTLPFGADYAIHITSPTEGTLWECVGDTWQQAAGVDWEFAQGDGGHTEIRLALDMASIGELGLIAFALDDEGNPWAVFPTTNLLTNLCSESFVWTGLANITIPNEGQPLGADLLMSLGSLQAPQGAWCPGSPLEYVISLNNLEGLNVVGLALDVFATAGLAFESVVGADCDVCPPLGDAWTLHVPSIETDASHNITITGVLSDDLSSLTTVDISATLKLSDTILSHVNISHRVDNQPPTVDIAATPGQVIGTGLQTVAGTASDGTGSGVASVEYSVDGGNTWHQASGTMNWTANVDVPTGISTLELLARAADTCGYIGQDTETFNVDIYAPSVTPDLPQYVTGSTANLGGTATDDEGQVAQVEVQFDDQTATWRRGQVYSPDASGTQNWNYTWSLPREDCVDHTLRVRATDSAGNTVVSGWLDVTVDNVPPTLAVAGTLAEVSLQDPADPIVLNGTAGDGCGLSSLEVIVYAPDGSSFREATQWDGVNWQYTPDLDNWVAGEYTLRVEAVDQAGNTTLRGPFKVQALECLNPNLTATFLTAEPASSVRIEARVSNTGGGGAPDGLSVAFYANGDLIGTAPTSQMLTAGLSETVAITWDPALCGDYDITIALNDDGAGSNPLNLCSAPPDVQQTVSILDVPLVERWNLVSTYVNPFTTNASVVQRPIEGQYVVIQGFDGGAQSYYPDLPPAVNTLKEMDAEHGYWIKTVTRDQGSGTRDHSSAVATLRVVGEKFAEDRAIELDAGWNLVSYLPRQPLAVADALQSIDGKYTVVLGYDQGALSYYPDIDPSFNTLREMKPMFGYWIKMVQAGTLQYPTTADFRLPTADLRLKDKIENRKSQIANPTNTWVNFYGTASLPVGTVVQAMDPDGVVCGATVITHEGQYGLLACYGDDPATPGDEGARLGDTIQLVVDGQVLGVGTCSEHGSRQWRPLGQAEVWSVYLPLIRKGSR